MEAVLSTELLVGRTVSGGIEPDCHGRLKWFDFIVYVSCASDLRLNTVNRLIIPKPDVPLKLNYVEYRLLNLIWTQIIFKAHTSVGKDETSLLYCFCIISIVHTYWWGSYRDTYELPVTVLGN